MPSDSQELTSRLKTFLKGDHKALNPGTALRDAASPPVTTLCTNTHRGFAFPPGNESRDKNQSGWGRRRHCTIRKGTKLAPLKKSFILRKMIWLYKRSKRRSSLLVWLCLRMTDFRSTVSWSISENKRQDREMLGYFGTLGCFKQRWWQSTPSDMTLSLFSLPPCNRTVCLACKISHRLSGEG